ncbi:hypothetical protein H1Q63_25840 [Desmonostoc muscorum CCALA 125]|nr:hypothetical protein [Desmonostoc muscorum CCALA 125]
MTHSTNTQSFNYFIDLTIFLADTEVKIEIPVRDEDKQAVDENRLEEAEFGITFIEELIDSYLNNNYQTDRVIKQLLDDCCDKFVEQDYIIRKVPA